MEDDRQAFPTRFRYKESSARPHLYGGWVGPCSRLATRGEEQGRRGWRWLRRETEGLAVPRPLNGLMLSLPRAGRSGFPPNQRPEPVDSYVCPVQLSVPLQTARKQVSDDEEGGVAKLIRVSLQDKHAGVLLDACVAPLDCDSATPTRLRRDIRRLGPRLRNSSNLLLCWRTLRSVRRRALQVPIAHGVKTQDFGRSDIRHRSQDLVCGDEVRPQHCLLGDLDRTVVQRSLSGVQSSKFGSWLQSPAFRTIHNTLSVFGILPLKCACANMPGDS